MKYQIDIRTPNKIFYVKGRPVRTPAQWVTTEEDLKNIELKIRTDAVSDYSIEPYQPKKVKKEKPAIIKEVPKPQKIKEEKPDETTTLGKLLNEDKDEKE